MQPELRRALRAVGVTGTNGKTTTTSLVAAALARVHAPVARITTLGMALVDRDGDAQALDLGDRYAGFVAALQACVDRGGRFAAIEATSEALANGFAQRCPCDVGVFTNLTRDHLDAHGSAEHYLASKAQLFVALPVGGVAILNGCDPSAPLLAEVVPAHARVVTYGLPSRGPATMPLDATCEAPTLSWSGTAVRARLGDRDLSLSTRAIGAHFAENAIAALLAAEALGVPTEIARATIGSAPAPTGRFEVVAEAPHVVVDYAHTPDAMARTIATARALAGGAKVTVVFGAGGERDRGKRPSMGAAASGADRIVLTSDNPRSEDPAAIARDLRAGITGAAEVVVELDRRQAIARAIGDSAPDDVVVLAGKGHERTQQIGKDRRALSDHDVAREVVAALGTRSATSVQSKEPRP